MSDDGELVGNDESAVDGVSPEAAANYSSLGSSEGLIM